MKKMDSGVSLLSAVTSFQSFAPKDVSNLMRMKLRLVKSDQPLLQVPSEERLQQRPPLPTFKQGLKCLSRRSAQLVKESPICSCSWCACKLLMDTIYGKTDENV
jgi:hypothetical protein